MKLSDCEQLLCRSRTGYAVYAWVLFLVAILGAAMVFAYTSTFSQFAWYDDCGFLMLTIQGYVEGHPLYDKIFTGYGAFYYIYKYVIHALASVRLTHDATGILCVVHWVGASALLALAGGLVSRSMAVGVFVFMQATVHLRLLGREPGHPQELVVLLLALSALVVARTWRRGRVALLLGAICGALAFTKINVGVFFLISLVIAFSCCSGCYRSRSTLFWAVLTMTSMMPFVLVRQHINESWAVAYATQVCISSVTAGVVAYGFGTPGDIRLADWMHAMIGCSGISLMLTAVILMQGSSLHALIRSTLLDSSKIGSVFCFPLTEVGGYWSCGVALVMAMAAVALKRRVNQLCFYVALGKGVYGLLGSLVLVFEPKTQLQFLLPWVWLVLLPVKNESKSSKGSYPRTFLCLTAIWQGLQAYPVAGTQVTVATFLPILIYTICLHDATSLLAERIQMIGFSGGWTSRSAALMKMLVLSGLFYVFVSWVTPLQRWRVFCLVPPLDLPGARNYRFDELQAKQYRMITQELGNQCDTFLTIPGLNSLYFWTDKRPPTYFGVNGEAVMPSSDQQAEIVAALKNADCPLVVLREPKWPRGVRFGSSLEGPLGEYISSEFRETKTYLGFRILARNDTLPKDRNALGTE